MIPIVFSFLLIYLHYLKTQVIQKIHLIVPTRDGNRLHKLRHEEDIQPGSTFTVHHEEKLKYT